MLDVYSKMDLCAIGEYKIVQLCFSPYPRMAKADDADPDGVKKISLGSALIKSAADCRDFDRICFTGFPTE